MIKGVHTMFYSSDADGLRIFLRDKLGLKAIDIGHGWLIFALPPAELAVHPTDEAGSHELYFMTDDLEAEMANLAEKGVECSPVEEARWGSVTKIWLPGGGHVGLYQPRHPSPLAPRTD
jgi:catechol 2,3-dioxygenase-like lactoylglutathione lyase family enzyme